MKIIIKAIYEFRIAVVIARTGNGSIGSGVRIYHAKCAIAVYL